MDLQLHIKMNPNLFVRDPESSELGRNIVKHSVLMIYELGFEEFTFKKLSQQIGTTEASIYRYFENKHRILTYITTWFWTWLEYQLIFHTNNMTSSKQKIETIIKMLTYQLDDKFSLDHIDKNKLHQIVISEGDKSYLTKHVSEDNKAHLFKPYKDLCKRIAAVLLEYNPNYKFPHSLASTLMETAHHQTYFKDYLPSLTDFGKHPNNEPITTFLNSMVFSMLDAQ